MTGHRANPEITASGHSSMKTLVIQVLLFREGKHWIAQGLEYDLAAQGKTKAETMEAFARTFIGRLVFDLQRNFEPLYKLSPAPDKFWWTYNNLVRRKRVLDTPQRMKIPTQMDQTAGLPPAFMIPVIQRASHEHSSSRTV